MVTFINYQFSVHPSYLEQLQKTMNQFEWYADFVSYTSDGEITLFDISDGNVQDAIEEVLIAFDSEALKTVKLDLTVFDNSVNRFRFNNHTQELSKEEAIDYIWSPSIHKKL